MRNSTPLHETSHLPIGQRFAVERNSLYAGVMLHSRSRATRSITEMPGRHRDLRERRGTPCLFMRRDVSPLPGRFSRSIRD